MRVAVVAASSVVVAAWAGCTAYGEEEVAVPGEVDAGMEAAADVLILPPGESTESDVDSGPIDAGGDGCVAFNDNFATGIGSSWIRVGVAKAATSGENGYVNLVGQQKSERGAIFRKIDPPATGFTASFSYFAQDATFAAARGDGVTFAWLGGGADADLADIIEGGGLGLPRAVPGYAFALDTFRNADSLDMETPFFSVLKLDPTRGPAGSYDWHVKPVGPYSGVYDAWKKITLTLVGGKLSVIVNTTKVVENVAVTESPIRAIGLTASTGGVSPVSFSVDSLSVKMTSATCP